MAHFDNKIFNPNVFAKYVDRIPNLKRNELLKSGAIKPRNDLKALFSEQTGSYKATIPVYGLIDGDALNYDGQTNIDTTSTTTYQQDVIVVGRAKAWVEHDFSYDITGGVNFMDNVAQQVAEYWDAVDQDTLLSILKGIFGMTGAAANTTFVSEHTYDISGAPAPSDQKVNQTTLNNAVQKACGDNKKAFSLVIMHSVVSTTLENLHLLEHLKYTDSQGIQRSLDLATWNGKLVLIDDTMPIEVVTGTGDDHTKYTTYVLGEGAFEFCDVGAKVPYEMARDPKTNGGQDVLYSRQRKLFAPKGISFVGTTTSQSPTKTELETGNKWALIKDAGSTKYIDHKAIPIARIISRG